MATTVSSDLFRPTKFGGKYTVTLIPGTTPRHYNQWRKDPDQDAR